MHFSLEGTLTPIPARQESTVRLHPAVLVHIHAMGMFVKEKQERREGYSRCEGPAQNHERKDHPPPRRGRTLLNQQHPEHGRRKESRTESAWHANSEIRPIYCVVVPSPQQSPQGYSGRHQGDAQGSQEQTLKNAEPRALTRGPKSQHASAQSTLIRTSTE